MDKITATPVPDKDGNAIAAVVPMAEFVHILERANIPLPDFAQTDEAILEAAIGRDEEMFPDSVVKRLVRGENPVKVYREHRGLTQTQLAERVDSKAAYISQIERGAAKPGRGMLARLATALNVDLDDLEEEPNWNRAGK